MKRLVTLGLVLLASAGAAQGRDDGRYAASALKPWFDSLRSGLGPCCSDADGTAVADVDWESGDGHYRVRLGGVWMQVPDHAVITTPNLSGRSMVWPARKLTGDARDYQGKDPPYGEDSWYIRCFMPGPMG